MRLHEYYFGNMTMGGKAIDKSSNLYKKIASDFGSYKNWEIDFKITGAMRGIGWVMLYYDPWADRLFNGINEHNGDHLCGTSPLLVMDAFEHAYMFDYGLKRTDYIEAFFKAIDWTVEDWVDKSWNLQDQSIHRCSQ
jgi:Fe-Mn family superoxide dismutase